MTETTNVPRDLKEEYPTSMAEGWKIYGGEGEARKCEVPGKVHWFHDGCGLASPGRWDLEKRIWNRDLFWENLRKGSMEIILQQCGGLQSLDRMCFEMAAKGEEGCTLVKNEAVKQQLVDFWSSCLEKEGYSAQGLTEVAAGQPFRLKLMEALLDRAGDPDHKFLLDGEKGFSGGSHKTPAANSPYVRGADILEA